MAILSKRLRKKARNESFMIGTYVPKKISTFLALYCLAYGITKTSIVKSLLIDWMKQQDVNDEKSLITLIVNRAFERWKTEISKRKSWGMFESDLTKELKKNHLTNYVEQILTELYAKKDEDEEKS